ncbi:hypothetical protein D0866_12317 [Hortaea werneckii]|uniref:Heterokaryon incompatibility domain-containing protein n=1 Tax=Hortaea werneckii TaxID=91943 RepID=A0A3M7A143_HORWE|nr:hypothetical protein D0866_12317 [Hortaea werneckii]
MERLHATDQAVSDNLKRAQPRPYHYIALEPDEIRLLYIHSINGETHWEKREDDPIRCSVWYCPRNGSPAYQALSYTWGGQERVHPVQVGDNTVLLVTKNCLAALRLLRQKNILVVWIDAVCIDQSNPAEKAIQVAMIGDVFRNATRTLIYTGSEAGDGAGVAGVGPSHNRSLVPSGMRKWLKGYEFEGKANSWSDTRSTFGSNMAQRPWFRRTWVVQELMLSRRPVIITEDGMIPLSSHALDIRDSVVGEATVLDLYVELSYEYGKTPRPVMFRRDSGPLVASDESEKGTETDESEEGTEIAEEPSQLALNLWRLPEILLLTCKFGCADPRDKVFAILPLFARPIPDLLQPDYSKAVEDVFTDVSWFMINYDSTTLGKEDLPSWVADWRGSRRRLDFHSVDNGKLKETKWHAGYSEYKQCFARRLGQRSLCLRGVLVDRVAELTPELVSTPCWESRRVRQPNRLEVQRCWQSIYRWEHESASLARDKPSPYQLKKKQHQTIASLVTHDHTAKAVATAHRLPFATRPYDFSRPAEHTPGVGPDRNTRLELAIARCYNRRLFRSVNFGLSGLGPAEAQPGDAVCVFLGYDIPFLMRQTPHGWELLGECLVAGIMEGEVVEDLDWTRILEGEAMEPLQDFHII